MGSSTEREIYFVSLLDEVNKNHPCLKDESKTPLLRCDSSGVFQSRSYDEGVRLEDELIRDFG